MIDKSMSVNTSVIKSLIRTSDQLIGDFQGKKVTWRKTDLYSRRFERQIVPLMHGMAKHYHELLESISNKKLEGSKAEKADLDQEVVHLHDQIQRMIALLKENKNVGDLAREIKGLRKELAQNEKMIDALARVNDELEALKTSIEKSVPLKILSPLLPGIYPKKKTLATIDENLQKHLDLIEELNLRNEAIESLEDYLEGPFNEALEAFKSHLATS